MSNEMQTNDELHDLAAQINAEHLVAKGFAVKAVEHAMLAGKLLVEAKGKLGHGGWLPWLKANCEVSERTAQAYMRLALKVPELDVDTRNAVADLPLREALCLLAEPKDPPPPAEKDEDILALMRFWLGEIDKANRHARQVYERLDNHGSMSMHEAIVYVYKRWATEMMEASIILHATIDRAVEAIGGIETIEAIVELSRRRLLEWGELPEDDMAARFARLGLSLPWEIDAGIEAKA